MFLPFAWVLSGGLLLIGGASSAHAQAEVTEETAVALGGRVVDAASGEPVGQAMVSLDDLDWGVFTDTDGHFELGNVGSGDRVLVAERLGYQTRLLRVEVGEDDASVTVALEPRPVLLEGISVVTDRFQRRRNATPTSVSAFDQTELLSGTYRSVTEFIEGRAGVPVVTCPPRNPGFNCALVRGQRRPVSVYIDEAPVMGGLDQLELYSPSDLYLLEIYARGAHIRAYTHSFMKHAASSRLYPVPLIF